MPLRRNVTTSGMRSSKALTEPTMYTYRPSGDTAVVCTAERSSTGSS